MAAKLLYKDVQTRYGASLGSCGQRNIMNEINEQQLFKNKYRISSIRLKDYDYASEGMYHVTICTKDNGCFFGEVIDGEMLVNDIGNIVKEYWLEIPKHFSNFALDEYVVMPNHIHMIIHILNVGAIHELPGMHDAFIRRAIRELPVQTKRRNMLLPKIMNSAKKINEMRHVCGSPVWQRSYYDRIIRNENELQQIREYIRNNPINWHLDRNNPEAFDHMKLERI